MAVGIGTAVLQEGASARFSGSPSEGQLQGSEALANLSFTLAGQVATQFKMSLLQLVEILKSKEPAYVRCIKPNDAKQPGRPRPPRRPRAGSPLQRRWAIHL